VPRQSTGQEQRRRTQDKAIDEERMFAPSEIEDLGRGIGKPPPTPKVQMNLIVGSNRNPILEIVGEDEKYKSFAWTATDQDFVQYECRWYTQHRKIGITRIDLTLKREGEQEEGPHSYQAGYRVEQMGNFGCQSINENLQWLPLTILDDAGAIMVTVRMAMVIYLNRPADTGPQPLRCDTTTPGAIFRKSNQVWVQSPESWLCYAAK